jgi:hypothetical protein
LVPTAPGDELVDDDILRRQVPIDRSVEGLSLVAGSAPRRRGSSMASSEKAESSCPLIEGLLGNVVELPAQRRDSMGGSPAIRLRDDLSQALR